MNTTSMLAEFITKSRLEDCPEAALGGARRAILDCLGVMLAGSIEPAARILQQVAQAEGGLPLATVVGTGRRTGAVWAALCNGTAAHALDFDDTNFILLGHPSAPVLAAALAAGRTGAAARPRWARRGGGGGGRAAAPATRGRAGGGGRGAPSPRRPWG